MAAKSYMLWNVSLNNLAAKKARDPEYSDWEHMYEELLYKVDCNVQSVLSVTKNYQYQLVCMLQ